MKITPSLLYDYLNCPHKVWRDKYGPQEEKLKEDNPFLQLLWDRGIQHEADVIKKFKFDFVDLSEGSIDERIKKTEKKIKKRVRFIYQGVIETEMLFGIPDLLELQEDGNYYPVDIKSGSGFESSDQDESVQKKNYAVQLCLYSEILIAKGLCRERKGYIIDRSGAKVEYDLTAQIGVRDKLTFWDFYLKIKDKVLLLISNKEQNAPAISGVCKLCTWYTSCKKWCSDSDDLTQIFYVGRKVRDTIAKDTGISTISDFIVADKLELLRRKEEDKEFLKGIGESTLTSAIQRATLLKNKSEPVVYFQTIFPKVNWELFWDIEDDPTQEFVYLHGIYIRNKDVERFKDFTAKDLSAESEREAWSNFWKFIDELPPNDFAVYYFSPHEKSTYKRLQKKYPEIIDEQKLTAFFENPNVIDLYQVILKTTDWSLGSYSIKSLATYCGFQWRDETPSGALSIQWFNEYLTTKDERVLKRILEYNEDDCKATLVVKDKLVAIQKK